MRERTELEDLAATLTSDGPASAGRIAAARQELRQLAVDDAKWRLRAAIILLSAGATSLATSQLRAFVENMGPADEALRSVRAEIAQLAIRLGDHAPLERYLRACYRADIQVEIGDPGLHHERGVVEWTLQSGQSRFTFSPNIILPGYQNTTLKHWAWALPVLLYFAQARPNFNGTVEVNLEDYGYHAGLAFCDHQPNRFLIPDPIFLGSNGYQADRAALDARAQPWSNRLPLAYWRGATTGQLQDDKHRDWRQLPRAMLCRIARDGPAQHFLDVALTGLAQLQDDEPREIRASGWMKPFDPLDAIMNYQFQIDIDGNSNAWRSLLTKLYSGSPVLKVQSPNNYRQWYYDRLKPWINMVPVAADMSDLHANLLWLKDNPAIAETIGRNGRALAEAMTPEREIPAAFPSIDEAFAERAKRI